MNPSTNPYAPYQEGPITMNHSTKLIQIISHDGSLFALGNDGSMYVFDTKTCAWCEPEFDTPDPAVTTDPKAAPPAALSSKK